MSETDTPKQLPVYVGTGPADRVIRFLDAVAAANAEHGQRAPLEPAGLLGRPGTDGYYHELLEDDLRALAGAAANA